MNAPTALQRTPLYELHVALGGKMVPFAGYEMPVQYAAGIIKEHLHTRAAAGLFDIAHMGLVIIESDNLHARVEKVVPADLRDLAPGSMRYSFLLNEQGGVLDDLMITRPASPTEQNKLYVVVNASCKKQDVAIFKKLLPASRVTLVEDQALIALQGPKAAEVLSRFCDAPQKLSFMQADKFTIDKIGECLISRSGYTGEDGFEIAVPNGTVRAFADALLAMPEVMAIGLGARDSLRLEAGLCLYGHELDPTITPVEAGLTWALSKRRRSEGGYVGAGRVQIQMSSGVMRQRVGIVPEGRAIAREQTEIQNAEGAKIGIVTSGGFGPSMDGPVAMGYVDTAYAKASAPVFLVIRGKPMPAEIRPLPFVPHRYHRGKV